MSVHPGKYGFPRQTAIFYGQPAGDVIARDIASSGKRRIFLVTSPSVAESDFYISLMQVLGSNLVGAYCACKPHSPRLDVTQATTAARELKADLLVAVGGGSVIDTTKAVQASLRFALESVDDLSTLSSDPRLRVGHPSLHSIAVPTTLSGAEFTNIAGITDTERGVKEIFQAPALYIDNVVLDPAATIGVPIDLFLASGVRAIDHCIETFCSTEPSAMGDATAREALTLLSAGLRRVYANRNDLDARLACQVATWLAITGSVGGVPAGGSHAIGRVLGGALGVAHGHTSCVLLPNVLRWNEPEDDGRQAQIAQIMGAPTSRAAEAVAQLVADLGLPTRLRDVRVEHDRFQEIAEKSLAMVRQPSVSGNRRRINTTQDVIEILQLAY